MKKFLRFKWWEVVILGSILLAGVAFGAAVFHESLTVTDEVKTLTASVYGPGAKKAWLSVKENDIVYTLDGVSTPTTGGVGHMLRTTDQGLWLENIYQIQRFKCVRASYRGDATLNVSYY